MFRALIKVRFLTTDEFNVHIFLPETMEASSSPVSNLNPRPAEKIWTLKLATRAASIFSSSTATTAASSSQMQNPTDCVVVLADSYSLYVCRINRAPHRFWILQCEQACQIVQILCTAAVTTSSAADLKYCLLVRLLSVCRLCSHTVLNSSSYSWDRFRITAVRLPFLFLATAYKKNYAEISIFSEPP